MYKYTLLGFPIIFYSLRLSNYFSNLHDYFPIILQLLINMIILIFFMILLLKRTKLQNVFDWLIGICFSMYFCSLYHNTVENVSYYGHVHYTLENLKYIVYSVNLIPVKGIIDVIRNSPNAMFQVFGNIIMLTPFTFTMLYFKWVKNYKQAILYSFLCSIGIELIQFIYSILALMFEFTSGRSTDIDDVILNTTGAFVGVGCYLLWVQIENKFRQMGKNLKRRFLTIRNKS